MKQFLVDELMDDSEERMCTLLEEWERWKKDESSGSRRRSRRHLNCDRETGHERLFNDYFPDEPIYLDNVFRRRFRMRKGLFLRIIEALASHSEYFRLRVDATGKRGLSLLQKCIAAIRQLAYRAPTDQYDEYIRIAEYTAIECLFKFYRCVIKIFAVKYLRRPNNEDVGRLLQLHSEHHGFPDMLGSIDCMHWLWKNCLVIWKGQFTRGDQRVLTIMLEVVASADLWIWHAFFRVVGSNNDINVLNQSPLFNDVLYGYAPEIQFSVNGTTYTRGYYLANGIYPNWATFVKSFSYPEDPNESSSKKYKKLEEKTLSEHLAYFNLDGQLCVGLLVFGTEKN